MLAAATALGVGQLVAGLTGANGSPVVAVGQLQIDFTPPWLKNFAINEFGSDDKLALVSGILVVARDLRGRDRRGGHAAAVDTGWRACWCSGPSG